MTKQKTTAGFVEDERGNRATISMWGSEDAARASLLTLVDCSGCSDCSYCSYCSDCSYCSHCSGCSYCSRCSKCPHQPATANRSDRYTFAAFRDDTGNIRIHAGCRRFTIDEAREHWSRTRGGTPLGDETMAILKKKKKAISLRDARMGL